MPQGLVLGFRRCMKPMARSRKHRSRSTHARLLRLGGEFRVEVFEVVEVVRVSVQGSRV